MTIRQQIISKMNEGQEMDVKPFVWSTIPRSLRLFWIQYFKNQKEKTNENKNSALRRAC